MPRWFMVLAGVCAVLFGSALVYAQATYLVDGGHAYDVPANGTIWVSANVTSGNSCFTVKNNSVTNGLFLPNNIAVEWTDFLSCVAGCAVKPAVVVASTTPTIPNPPSAPLYNSGTYPQALTVHVLASPATNACGQTDPQNGVWQGYDYQYEYQGGSCSPVSWATFGTGNGVGNSYGYPLPSSGHPGAPGTCIVSVRVRGDYGGNITAWSPGMTWQAY